MDEKPSASPVSDRLHIPFVPLHPHGLYVDHSIERREFYATCYCCEWRMVIPYWRTRQPTPWGYILARHRRHLNAVRPLHPIKQLIIDALVDHFVERLLEGDPDAPALDHGILALLNPTDPHA